MQTRARLVGAGVAEAAPAAWPRFPLCLPRLNSVACVGRHCTAETSSISSSSLRLSGCVPCGYVTARRL